MMVRPATEGDIDAIVRILRSRPWAFHVEWTALPGADWYVAEDADGVAAFMALHLEPGRIVADQLEILWTADGPTQRGRRGALALEAAINRLAEPERLTVYTFVNQANARHLDALKGRGYVEIPVVVLARKVP